MAFVFQKDPNARKDYEIDCRAWLNGDTLTAVQFLWQTGATVQVDSSSFSPEGIVTVWLVGGTDQTTDYMTFRPTTALGRSDDWTIQINVRSQ